VVVPAESQSSHSTTHAVGPASANRCHCAVLPEGKRKDAFSVRPRRRPPHAQTPQPAPTHPPSPLLTRLLPSFQRVVYCTPSRVQYPPIQLTQFCCRVSKRVCGGQAGGGSAAVGWVVRLRCAACTQRGQVRQGGSADSIARQTARRWCRGVHLDLEFAGGRGEVPGRAVERGGGAELPGALVPAGRVCLRREGSGSRVPVRRRWIELPRRRRGGARRVEGEAS
jgi:hypothetical protein